MKKNTAKAIEKIVRQAAYLTSSAGSLLYCYQPKEPVALKKKKMK